MVTLIVLIVLILIGIWLDTQDSFFGVLMWLFGAIFLLIHVIGLFAKPIEHNIFVSERKAFVETLEEARDNEKTYEKATITKNISNWNQELAKRKYLNTHWFLGQYIDNRIKEVKPIK